jgi:hypothetical protein
VTLKSRRDLIETSPNLDVCRRVYSVQGRDTMFAKWRDRLASSSASVGRNGQRSQRAWLESVTEMTRRLRSLWIRWWVIEGTRARTAQKHVHTRRERANSVKGAATLAIKSFASASCQNGCSFTLYSATTKVAKLVTLVDRSTARNGSAHLSPEVTRDRLSSFEVAGDRYLAGCLAVWLGVSSCGSC